MTGLSFFNKLKEIPTLIQGIDRVSFIYDLIEKNPDYRFEAKMQMESFLRNMEILEASDMDFGGMGTNNTVWFRVGGKKMPNKKWINIDEDVSTALICSILGQRQMDALLTTQNADFSYKLGYGGDAHRFRADAYLDMDLLAINFRRINSKPYDLETYGFSPFVFKRLDLRYEKRGLILVTGITGSGKSTTLDAIVDMNNKTNDSHIVIIGKPIEYFHKSKKSLVRHREVGRDTLSFKEGSIEALRQDPDIIVVGEMRDPETIITVLETTDSGHKVLSTLHTSSAIESVHRIIAECPSEEQNRVRNRLADILSVVISQKLVPDINGKLILVKEVLNVTPSVSAAIQNNNISEIYQMITEGKEYGMISMEQDLYRLYSLKKITKQTAMAHANNKKRMKELIDYLMKR